MEAVPASDNRDQKAKIARAAVFASILAACAILAVRFVHVALNTSSSMPLGLYRTWDVDRAPRRGDIVTVCAPPAVAAAGARRGYIPQGPCDERTAPLIKYVAATAGDTVAISKSGVTVDGVPLRNSGTFDRDGAGRPLHAYGVIRARLRAGEIWLYAPQARSFDSRYFGPISSARVRAFAAPLAVF